MRVIAGEKRGMNLYSPEDQAVRPTTDKIKGAIFNSIQNHLYEAHVFVDLFGGSGAMGIEALSRGVAEAWFFDTAKASITLINKNLTKAGFNSRAHVIQTSANAGIQRLSQAGIQGDIFFLDPPYAMGKEIPEILTQIMEKKCLKNDGIIVIETDKNVIIPTIVDRLTCVRQKVYGITKISSYEAIK